LIFPKPFPHKHEDTCGHHYTKISHFDIECPPCKVSVLKIIPGSEHIYRGTCGSCKQGTPHIPYKERCSICLPCGHQCMANFSDISPPCKHRCEKRSLHSRCILICGTLCVLCMEKCEWKCEHHTCDLEPMP